MRLWNLISLGLNNIWSSSKRIANAAFCDITEGDLFFTSGVQVQDGLSYFGLQNEDRNQYVKRLQSKERVRALIVDMMLLGYSYGHAIMLLAEDSKRHSQTLARQYRNAEFGNPLFLTLCADMLSIRAIFTQHGFLSATEARIALVLRAPIVKLFKFIKWVKTNA